MTNKKLEESTTDINKLKEWYDISKTYYSKDHRRMRLLDAADRGEIWKALNAKFPGYQILPDTNFVSYIKNNILASIYTVVKSAEVEPTSEDDKEITMHLNIAMERIWDTGDIGLFQFKAGERAALLNLGVTQVGWDDSLAGGSGNSFYKGNVTLKNIDPIKFMREPFSTSLETANYCMIYETYHKSVFLDNKLYAEEYKKYKEKSKDRPPLDIPQHRATEHIPKGGDKNRDTLVVFWVRDGKKVNEIHTVNIEHILHEKKGIQPSEFPIVELHCNLPADSLVGVSEPAKILANNIAYNIMDSIALTAEYKNQRPPKFISSGSGLNIATFSKHGDEADRTFVVNGPADKAVHYHQFPPISPIMSQLKMGLEKGIQLVSGVDGRYTGRDTGSIITTGGTEEMLNRVTLIDTPKIAMYEAYVKRLTYLILANFIEYSPKRKYFYKKPNTTKWETIEVDFPKIDRDTLFHYSINISSDLPKNKQRVAEMANQLMEKQMQYRQEGDSTVELITEEEWLMFQDLPRKEYMLERMGIQRQQDALEEVSQVLFEYAELVKNGVSPQDALAITAEGLKNKRQGIMPGEGELPAALPMGGPGMVPGMMPPGGGGGMMPPGGGMMPPGGGGMPPMGM
jgi:hypothetical protein